MARLIVSKRYALAEPGQDIELVTAGCKAIHSTQAPSVQLWGS
jgi:hypothetical protein